MKRRTAWKRDRRVPRERPLRPRDIKRWRPEDGEVLLITAPPEWGPAHVHTFQEALNDWWSHLALPGKALVLPYNTGMRVAKLAEWEGVPTL